MERGIWMRNVVFLKTLLALAVAASPLAAQDPKPEPAPQQPTLEKPQMAPATEQPPPAKAKTAPAKPPVKPNPDSGKVVEEIIARVNNEIITRSEYEKSLAQTEDETRQDCKGKCTPEQLA